VLAEQHPCCLLIRPFEPDQGAASYHKPEGDSGMLVAERRFQYAIERLVGSADVRFQNKGELL
jgi:hypothetical protein